MEIKEKLNKAYGDYIYHEVFGDVAPIFKHDSKYDSHLEYKKSLLKFKFSYKEIDKLLIFLGEVLSIDRDKMVKLIITPDVCISVRGNLHITFFVVALKYYEYERDG